MSQTIEKLKHYYVQVLCDPRFDTTTKQVQSLAESLQSQSIEQESGEQHTFLTIAFKTFDEAEEFSHVVQNSLHLTSEPRILAWQGRVLTCVWHNSEKRMQSRIHAQLGGSKEVKTPLGRIDLLTSTHLIEIKNFKDWKSAVGQVLVYKEFYPDRQACIYLFAKEIPQHLEVIERACRKHSITLKFELDRGWRYDDEESGK